MLPRKGLIERIFLFFLLLIFSWKAAAEAEYVSISENAVIMYDAPSLSAEKLFVASIHLPLEVLVKVEGWVKVRDSSGVVAWVESKYLSDKRFVMVTVPLADVYQSANVHSPLVFRAQKNVVIEWLSSDVPGWVEVRHPDGRTGYIESGQIWGS